MAAGMVLVLLSGLATLALVTSLTERVDVVVAARAIGEGEVIVEGDLSTVSITPASGIRAIAPAQRGELVGKVATGPIGEGSIVHPSQFTEGSAAGGRTVIVGAALEAGQYPVTALVSGSKVRVIEVSGSNPPRDGELGPRELAEAEIVAVVPLARSDDLLVSFRVDESIAIPISERAEQGRIRLVLVDDAGEEGQ